MESHVRGLDRLFRAGVQTFGWVFQGNSVGVWAVCELQPGTGRGFSKKTVIKNICHIVEVLFWAYGSTWEPVGSAFRSLATV